MSRIVEICHPIFDFVCQVNRNRRLGVSLDAVKLRGTAERLLKQAAALAEAEGLNEEFAVRDPELRENRSLDSIGVERILCQLIDDTMNRWQGPHRDAWVAPPGYLCVVRYADQGWATTFFEQLDFVLNDCEGEQVRGRREIYLHALALGFTGEKYREVAQLRDYMTRLKTAIGFNDELVKLEDPIVPGIEKIMEEREVVVPPAVVATRAGVAVAAMVVVVLIANFVTYWWLASGLQKNADEFQRIADVRDGEEESTDSDDKSGSKDGDSTDDESGSSDSGQRNSKKTNEGEPKKRRQ
jgi:hypothetical protein